MAPQKSSEIKSPKIRDIKLGPTRKVIISTGGNVIFVLKGSIRVFDTRTIFVRGSCIKQNLKVTLKH